MVLKDGLDFAARGVLSPSQGHIICVYLCGRTLTHVHLSHRGRSAIASNYNFWTEHHHINQILVHASTVSLAHLTRLECSTNPEAMALNLMLQATTACLNYVLIRRSVVDTAVPVSSRKSQETCLEAALNVANIMRGAREDRVIEVSFSKPTIDTRSEY